MGNVRVRGHDYHARGYYFITFGTYERCHCLSSIQKGRVVLKPAGELLLEIWHRIVEEDPVYELGVSVVMPDHFHALAIYGGAPKYVIGTHVSRVKGRVFKCHAQTIEQPRVETLG